MAFTSRNEAAVELADLISKQHTQFDMLVALPRGGVPIGMVISNILNIPMSLFYVKKLGHPQNEELAIGAISENGIQLNETFDIEAGSLSNKISIARNRIIEMKKRFNLELDLKKVKKKNILLVDDGIATGQCMLLAVHEIQKGNPQNITVATPVCSFNAKENIKTVAKDIISILTPRFFGGIGQFYEDFHQMTDQEVIRIIHEKGCLKRQPVNSVSNG